MNNVKMKAVDLINKYVPVKTRAEWMGMLVRHEETVTGLLQSLHTLHEQHKAMMKDYDALQRETYNTYMPRLSFGKVAGEVYFRPQDMQKSFSLRWQPDPMQINVIMQEFICEGEQNHILRALKENFVKDVSQYLGEQAERTIRYSFDQMRSHGR